MYKFCTFITFPDGLFPRLYDQNCKNNLRNTLQVLTVLLEKTHNGVKLVLDLSVLKVTQSYTTLTQTSCSLHTSIHVMVPTTLHIQGMKNPLFLLT